MYERQKCEAAVFSFKDSLLLKWLVLNLPPLSVFTICAMQEHKVSGMSLTYDKSRQNKDNRNSPKHLCHLEQRWLCLSKSKIKLKENKKKPQQWPLAGWSLGTCRYMRDAIKAALLTSHLGENKLEAEVGIYTPKSCRDSGMGWVRGETRHLETN